jgi:hypothetical protein
VAAPRYFSLLCFERVSPELVRVLNDARCSFLSTDGQFHLARPIEVSGSSKEAASFALSVLANPGQESSTTTIDLGAGRDPEVNAVLSNPIKLLHWLVAQAAAVDFHPTVNAYIGSSDPDDILPYLPFHPGNGEGGVGPSTLVAVRVRGFLRLEDSEAPGSVTIGGLELWAPGEALRS